MEYVSYSGPHCVSKFAEEIKLVEVLENNMCQLWWGAVHKLCNATGGGGGGRGGTLGSTW